MNGKIEIDFNGKQILLLGFGLEGQASLKFLKDNFKNTIISIADRSSNLNLDSKSKILISKIYQGEDWLNAISDYDVIIRSPGIPLSFIENVTKKLTSSPVVTSATEIFLRKNYVKTIGVTGTKGKSTTSSLLKDILTACGYKVVLLGNIGMPAITLIDEKVDYFIYELSSYQLQDISFSPHISFFLNFYPEHLDHHETIEKYFAAKCRIFEYQNENDILFIGDQLVSRIHQIPKSKIQIVAGSNSSFYIDNSSIFSNLSSFSFDMKKTLLRGVGNLNNLLAVFEFAQYLKLDLEVVSRAIYDFKPLPHRLEIIGSYQGVQFVNDSISTVPQATINAIDAFTSKIKTLILGGFDRGVDFQELASLIIESGIPLLLLLKPSGERILDSVKKSAEISAKLIPEMIFIDSMEEAIRIVLEKKFETGVCLLSPASPSFGKFKNFEERGKCFRDAVLNLDRAECNLFTQV